MEKSFLEKYEIVDLTLTLRHDMTVFPAITEPIHIQRNTRAGSHGNNSDHLSMSAHAGTHLDGPTHWNCGFHDRTKTLINDIPLENIIGEGVIVDISSQVEDFDIYGPEEILASGADIRKGDILIINTGWHKYQAYGPEENEIRYFYKAPGPKPEFAKWCVDMEFKLLGTDTCSQDHPMNTKLAPLPEKNGFGYVTREFCEKYGVEKTEDIFPAENYYPMHWIFEQGLLHIENVGGDIDRLSNRRCIIACFPLNIAAESSPVRLVALIEKEA